MIPAAVKLCMTALEMALERLGTKSGRAEDEYGLKYRSKLNRGNFDIVNCISEVGNQLSRSVIAGLIPTSLFPSIPDVGIHSRCLKFIRRVRFISDSPIDSRLILRVRYNYSQCLNFSSEPDVIYMYII